MRAKPYPLDKYVYLFRNKKTGKVVKRYSEFMFDTLVAEHVMNDGALDGVWERVVKTPTFDPFAAQPWGGPLC